MGHFGQNITGLERGRKNSPRRESSVVIEATVVGVSHNAQPHADGSDSSVNLQSAAPKEAALARLLHFRSIEKQLIKY